jgi:FtsP/CotA-like multicopper oxidase with cupredoxin domain
VRPPRWLLASAASLVVLAPVGWAWQQSLVPSTYSVMEMGYVDRGTVHGEEHHDHEHHHGAGTATVSVAELVADPEVVADVTATLVVRQERIRLASGREVEGFTVNGSSPGPLVSATVGDMVEVTVRNDDVGEGATLHWHGVDVPNAADGVAGVTQDAIAPGEEHVYRFEVDRAGTFWYHAHQASHPQVTGGLLGPLVVLPEGGVAQDHDVLAVAHTYRGTRTLNGREGVVRVGADPGETVRVRVVNTDGATLDTWADTDVRVLAVDGSELVGPTPVHGHLRVPAAGRVDLEVTVPEAGATRLQVGGATAMVIGPSDAEEPAATPRPTGEIDLLDYGTAAGLPFDPERPDRDFDYSIGRRLGFVDGRPGVWWSINGHLWPDIPMFMVRRGDVVRVRVENHSGDVHPMHLHGHRALLVSRDGRRSTGSPVWVDSFDVASGETVEVVFVADNPGIWMDHCHNLEHAADGLVAHLMYEGVTTPYLVGGDAHNHPE